MASVIVLFSSRKFCLIHASTSSRQVVRVDDNKAEEEVGFVLM